MSLRLRNVQVVVPDAVLDATVAFWAHALGAEPGTAHGPATHLVGIRAEFGLHVLGQGQEPASYHLDLEVEDIEAEVARLVGLGAQVVGGGGAVVTDPAGTVCRLVPPEERRERTAPRDPRHAYLDAVVLDVPASLEEETAAFWASALGVAPFERQRPDDPFLWSDDLHSTVGAYDLGVQRVGDGTRPRVHLDTICDDVPGEIARLVDHGGTVMDELPRWTVLADPAGTLLCVVDSSKGPTDSP